MSELEAIVRVVVERIQVCLDAMTYVEDYHRETLEAWAERLRAALEKQSA